MIMDERPFFDWIRSDAPSAEERLLVEKVGVYQDLFDDMLFEPGTETYELVQSQSLNTKTGYWIEDEVPRPNILTCFSTSFLKYRVEELDGMLGYYNPDEQLICVSPEGLKNDRNILHEMIHVFEGIINELPMYYHDMLFWGLYKSLKKRIPMLDNIISDHAHLLTGTTLDNYGGVHDILFLLKSFDLDIQMGYHLGTVFGYGRIDDFKDCEYE